MAKEYNKDKKREYNKRYKERRKNGLTKKPKPLSKEERKLRQKEYNANEKVKASIRLWHKKARKELSGRLSRGAYTIANNAIVISFSIGYKINDFGDVFSPAGVKLNPRKGKNYFMVGIKPFEDLCVPIEIKIHRMQAYKKFGDKIFEKGIIVRHLNGNPLDNSWGNIEIGTYSDNAMDIPEEKRKERGRKAAQKRYSDEGAGFRRQ